MSRSIKAIFRILARFAYGCVAGLIVFGIWLLIWEVLVYFFPDDNILIVALSDFRYLAGTLAGVIVGAVFGVRLEIPKDDPAEIISEENFVENAEDTSAKETSSGEIFEESSEKAAFEAAYGFADNFDAASKYGKI